jgi:hypothetical protein
MDGNGTVRATVKVDQHLLEDIKADARISMRPWTLHIVALAKEALQKRGSVRAAKPKE